MELRRGLGFSVWSCGSKVQSSWSAITVEGDSLLSMEFCVFRQGVFVLETASLRRTNSTLCLSGHCQDYKSFH